MLRRIMVVLLIIGMTLVMCSSLSAREKRDAKTKPLEVKSSFDPPTTRVAVLQVTNLAAEKKYVKEEINQSLVTTRKLIEKAFTDRGFAIVADSDVSKIALRLDPVANNGADLAKQLDADLIVDCSVKELYTFVSRSLVQRCAGVAVINLKLLSAKDGCLINDDFLSRHDGPPGVFGWATKNSEIREEALKEVVKLALDGLLKPYSNSAKSLPVMHNAVEQSTFKPPQQNAILTEKKPDPPAVAKEPVFPTVTTQPQVTKGPNYITVSGNALVPLRSIAEWLKASVDFDVKSNVIELKIESSTVSLKLNSDLASVNGKLAQLQSPAIERNGTTYVPLRFIGQAFAAKIKFEAATGRIRIENQTGSAVLVLSR